MNILYMLLVPLWNAELILSQGGVLKNTQWDSLCDTFTPKHVGTPRTFSHTNCLKQIAGLPSMVTTRVQ